MRREDVLAILATHREELRETYGVKSFALFGFLARNEARPDSDVDILVEFAHRPIGLFEFIELKMYLEQLLGTSVDLATPNSLNDQVRPGAERDVVNVH